MAATLEPLASVFVVLFGLVLGSFLNVCIHRLPRHQSIVRPRSRCPGCGEPIRWHQNIPVVSWIVLRARCASCGRRISWRYPFVELLTAAVLLALWLAFGPSRAFIVAAPFCLAMMVLFFTDLDLRLLPDAITLPGVATGIALAWINPFLGQETPMERLWMAASGAALGAAVLWGIGALWSRVRRVEAMGLGDVKLLAMVGAFTGPLGVLFTLFGASLFGAVVGLAQVVLRGRSLQDTLPFGCFLAPGAVVTLLFGRRAIGAYVDLVLGRL
jgi:leader peptidase (prepilin peptidase)/N-methyltransferase